MGNSLGCSPKGELLLNAVRDRDEEQVQLLLKLSSKLSRFATFGVRNSALHCAAARGYCEIMSLILEHGADANLRNSYGQTALILACRFGHWRAVQLLLLHNADIHTFDIINGRTAIHFAASGGHPQCIRLLLADYVQSAPVAASVAATGTVMVTVQENWSEEHGPLRHLSSVVNVRADNGVAPLHLAAINGHADCVHLLLNLGARVNLPTGSEGGLQDAEAVGAHSSPLHYAACGGSLLCCQILLAHGADRSRKNGNGWTPQFVARLWNHSSLNQLLDPDTPLMLPAFLPSSFLSVPLLSIMQIARQLSFRGFQQAAAGTSCASSPPAAAAAAAAEATVGASSLCVSAAEGASPVPQPACSTTAEKCSVCLENECQVAAAGCSHELCLLCALDLCCIGSLHSAINTNLPSLAAAQPDATDTNSDAAALGRGEQSALRSFSLHEHNYGAIPCPLCRNPVVMFTPSPQKESSLPI